jgi:hypothetical protein
MLTSGYRIYGIVTGFESNEHGTEFFKYHHVGDQLLPDGYPTPNWNYVSRLNEIDPDGEILVEVISEAQDR